MYNVCYSPKRAPAPHTHACTLTMHGAWLHVPYIIILLCDPTRVHEAINAS